MAVAIQPAGSPASRQHYLDTIENPVKISQYEKLLGSDLINLQKVSNNGLTALWGVTPGANNANVSKYKRLAAGDTVVFTRDKTVFASAQITYLFRNKQLAENLWGKDNKNQTWEYMYALSHVEKISLSYRDLQSAIGSKSGDNFMGFRVLDDEKSECALRLIGEDHTLLKQIADDLEEKLIVQRVNIGPLEKENLVRARRGQGLFKKNVQLYESGCRVTGLTDINHLIASHIKPWAKSNDKEKIDGNNGLLLSHHIDHLFNDGYISFSNVGDLLVSKKLKVGVLEKWKITLPINVGQFSTEKQRYLGYHNKFIFKQ